MQRRQFIKHGCFACMALGAGVALTSCSTALPICKKTVQGDTIEVDPIEFTEGSKVVLIRTGKLDYDILLVKNGLEDYRALLLVCSHNEFPLSPTRNTILCSSHGSEFDFKGNAKSGPAKKRLKNFPVSVSGSKIIISLKESIG